MRSEFSMFLSCLFFVLCVNYSCSFGMFRLVLVGSVLKLSVFCEILEFCLEGRFEIYTFANVLVPRRCKM